MADFQHPDLPQAAAHTSFRYASANLAAHNAAVGSDHTSPDEGLLALQADTKRVQYLSASGNPGTWTTLLPGYTATAAAPTVNDDVNDGYEPGHIWVDTSGPAAYICVGNTAGAADWNRIDVASPVGAGADNRLARYDGAGSIQQSGITVDDSDNVSGVGTLTASAVHVSADGGGSSRGIGWSDVHLYRSGANSLGFSANNQVRMLMNTGGLRLAIAGSAGTPSARLNSNNTGLFSDVAGAVQLSASGVESVRADDDATAGNTRLMIYDVDNATLERVTVGAADSGGAGFKVLRIPN